jgi:hypothetical protein
MQVLASREGELAALLPLRAMLEDSHALALVVAVASVLLQVAVVDTAQTS